MGKDWFPEREAEACTVSEKIASRFFFFFFNVKYFRRESEIF